MKRCLAVMLTMCFCLLTLLPITAAQGEQDQWSVYVAREDANGMPVFEEPPTYAYGEQGLLVTPLEGMRGYTIQSDEAISLDEGFFLQLRVEDLSLKNTLMIHLWSQSGVLIGNYNSGSGWYAMTSVHEDGNDIMMSLNVTKTRGSTEGSTSILGTMKVKTVTQGKGGIYTLSADNGILRMNGSVIPGLDEVVDHLKAECPQGKVYVGVTLMSFDESIPVSALCLTRFGRDEATATVPGAEDPSESLPAEDQTAESLPAETAPAQTTASTDAPTVPFGEETGSVTTEVGEEGQGSLPETTEPESESETLSSFERLKDAYGQASTQCRSTIGLGGLGYLFAVTLAALLLRKRRD